MNLQAIEFFDHPHIASCLDKAYPSGNIISGTALDLDAQLRGENTIIKILMVRYIPSEPPHNPIRMAEVLAAFSLATDLGTGKPMGNAIRACYLSMKIADLLHLRPEEQVELYYSFLLMHSSCTVLSLGLASSIQGDDLRKQYIRLMIATRLRNILLRLDRE